MILQFRRFILSSLGFLLLAFFGQPLWTALHGALAKLPSRTQSLTTASAPIGDVASKSSLASSQSYLNLPIYFEPNVGQTDSQVKFIARGSGVTTFLTATEAVFSLPIADFGLPNGKQSIKRVGCADPADWGQRALDLRPGNLAFGRSDSRLGPTSRTPLQSPQSAISNRQLAISMKLVGANPNAQIEGLDRLFGISNYFIGNDPTKWLRSIPQYAKVRYREVYRGIDLVYHGTSQRLEYDFIAEPGADLRTIQLAFEGAKSLQLDSDGSLVIKTSAGEVRQHAPEVYQIAGGRRREVSGRYSIREGQTVGFELAPYEEARTVIIDPVISFEGTFAGSSEENFGSVAVDSSGNLYLAGTTSSLDFPTTPGAFKTKNDMLQTGYSEVVVTKVNSSGSTVLYSTYFGGSRSDGIAAIAVDSFGNAYFAGTTDSLDLPIVSGAPQPAFAGGSSDAFVAKLDGTGAFLRYSTYLGGSDNEAVIGIALDSSGNALVTGSTESSNFPAPTAFPTNPSPSQRIRPGYGDSFVTKVNPAGTFLFSALIGGSESEYAFGSAVDASGNAYVTGITFSTDFPTTPLAYRREPSSRSGFVTKLNTAGTSLVYSTFMRTVSSTDYDSPSGITVDADGSAVVSGQTYSGSGFIEKLNPAGSGLVYRSTLAGGIIEVDAVGNLYVLDSNMVLKKLDPFGSVVRYTRAFGGYDPRLLISTMTVDAAGNVYLAGQKSSGATTYCSAGRFLSTNYEKNDAYFAKVADADTTSLFVPIVLSASGLNGSLFTSELTLTNTGTKDAHVDFIYTAAFGDGSGTASTTLPGGHQRIVPDAIAYLRSLGVPIPQTGNQGGTLTIRFSGLSSSVNAAALVRTTTAVNNGRAGLAYPAVSKENAFTDTVYLCGLRQNSQDRSNVAVQNAGAPGQGDVALRLTVFSGDPTSPQLLNLPEQRLSPGEFRQISGILQSNGLSVNQGYVRVERVSGSAPFYAYGVINDQVTSDGSFVPPVSQFAASKEIAMNLPAMVESDSFSTELILTNWSISPKRLSLSLRADSVATEDRTATFTLHLNAGEQRLIPKLVQFFRDQAVTGIGPAGPAYVGTLRVQDVSSTWCENLEGIAVSARTSSETGGLRFGVFYPALPERGAARVAGTWLYGLQQDRETRTNLAIADLGFDDSSGDTGTDQFKIELFDGETGAKVHTIESFSVTTRQWKQIGSILSQYAPGTRQGYARVLRVGGNRPFITYAVINDGATPGERTGDGAFIASSP